MKRSLIAMSALLLLLCAGGLGFYSTQARASGGGEEAAEGGKISYIEMSPILLPIIDRDGISQMISLVVSIQVDDPLMAEEVKHNLPKLADAFLSDMYGTLSKKAVMEGGVIKVSMLKARLVKVSQKVMGEGKVSDVLLQVLQQRPAA